MRLLTCLGLLSLTALAACNPTFNWREVRVPDTQLTALLPCKPDQATRPMAMGAAQVNLHLQGCETGAATFAIATLTAPGDASSALTAWKAAALAPLQAIAPQLTTTTAAIRISGVLPSPQSPQHITTVGQRADGRRIESQAVYFTQGQQLFQVVILAERISPDVAETFFSGLKLQ